MGGFFGGGGNFMGASESLILLISFKKNMQRTRDYLS